jgi:hypothetical protein
MYCLFGAAFKSLKRVNFCIEKNTFFREAVRNQFISEN